MTNDAEVEPLLVSDAETEQARRADAIAAATPTLLATARLMLLNETANLVVAAVTGASIYLDCSSRTM
jgi:hypothetical protein